MRLKVELLTEEWMIKTLMNLGFERHAAKVYAFLTIKGPQKAAAIAEGTKILEGQVYPTLKRLLSQKIITETDNLPTHFVALSFDKLLDLLENMNLQEATRMEQNKENVLALWNLFMKKTPSHSLHSAFQDKQN